MKMKVFITVIVLALVSSSGIAVAQMHGDHHGQGNGSSSSSGMMCNSTTTMSGESHCCDKMKGDCMCEMMENMDHEGMMGAMCHDMMDSSTDGGMMQMDSMCGCASGKEKNLSCKCKCKCKMPGAAAPKDRPSLK